MIKTFFNNRIIVSSYSGGYIIQSFAYSHKPSNKHMENEDSLHISPEDSPAAIESPAPCIEPGRVEEDKITSWADCEGAEKEEKEEEDSAIVEAGIDDVIIFTGGEYQEEEVDNKEAEDPKIEEDEVLKQHCLYQKGMSMDYDGMHRQIEGLRGQISQLNNRIVDLECSMGRVGLAFSQMTTLHSVYQGKTSTSLGNARGGGGGGNRRREDINQQGGGDQGYQINNSRQQGQRSFRNGRHRDFASGGNGRGGKVFPE